MGTELHRRFNSHPLTSDQVERTAEIRTASYQLAKTIDCNGTEIHFHAQRLRAR